jgi:NAD(P)-dependent dehydrogenase (short-subunit alcohol dehydrogenase family)
MVSFDGRTVLVTGGGRGIGRAACEQFGRLGANVVVNDIGGSKTGEGDDERPAETVAGAVENAGGSAVPEFSDVGTMDGAEAAVETAYEAFGGLDVVYNNAGILRESTLVNMSEEEFDEVIRVHLKGMFAVTRHAAECWRDDYKDHEPDGPDDADTTDRWGDRAVVNASSDVSAGAFSGQASAYGLGNYAMAKAGILGLTRTAAEELAAYDVRVNAIWPAADTRLTETLPVDLPGPDPVAALVAYLASEECRASGQTFRVGGDRLDLISPAPRTEATAYAGGDSWTLEELADRFGESVGQRVDDPF